jgi:hypothetical protein
MYGREVQTGKRDGKGPLGRPRRVREDKIKTGLKEIDWESVTWVGQAQDLEKQLFGTR